MGRRAFVAGLVVLGLASCVNMDGLQGGPPRHGQPEGGADAGAEAEVPLQPDASLDPSLVGLWTFDEPNADIARDTSGNGHDAILQMGAKVRAEAGYEGSGGLVLFADEDGALVSSLAGDKFPRTGTLWIRFKYTFDPNDGKNHPLFDSHDPSRNHVFFRRPNGASTPTSFQFALQSTGSTVYRFVEQVEIPRDTWTRAAMTWSEQEGNGALFIDDDLRLRASYLNGPFLPTEQVVRFGGNFPGVIDEVRLYDRVLLGTEVSALR